MEEADEELEETYQAVPKEHSPEPGDSLPSSDEKRSDGVDSEDVNPYEHDEGDRFA